MGKVVKFETKDNQKINECKSVYKRAFLNLFKKTEKQKYIINRISEDVGGFFNLIILPNEMQEELIGIGTLKYLDSENGIEFKKRYTEQLASALEFLQCFEKLSDSAIGR